MAARNLDYEIFIRGVFGEILARSCNLRGVLTYARKSPVMYAEVVEIRTFGNLPSIMANVKFRFYDGATCNTGWADASVAHDWLHNRRAWGEPIDKDTNDDGSYTCYWYV